MLKVLSLRLQILLAKFLYLLATIRVWYWKLRVRLIRRRMQKTQENLIRLYTRDPTTIRNQSQDQSQDQNPNQNQGPLH